MTTKSPRQSAKTRKSPYIVFYAASLFIVTGWLGMVGLWEYSAHLIASQAHVATATITGKVMHPAGQEGYTKTAYEEDFVFTTAAGKQIEGKTNLTADSWDRIKPGDTFQVTYAASEPGTYHIGTDTNTTLSDCVFLGVLVIWLVFLRLTIRARHRRPTPRTRSEAAPDSLARAPPPAAARAPVNGAVLMGAALLVVGGVFLLIGVANLVSERGFRAHGKAATAIVLTKSTVIGKNGDSYPLDVRFTTDEGKSIETSIGVDYATMTSLHEHLPVTIIYAPEHPEKIRLASDGQFSTFVALWFFSALGGILAIGGAIMMSFGFLDAKRERLLHGCGESWIHC
ncbi:MAG: DUF3592 domain-containing protein [Steroidobacteraceae bacterium]